MKNLLKVFQDGAISFRELRGITDAEMQAAIDAGRRLMSDGELQAAAEVFSGLMLYDPCSHEVWRALEDLFRIGRCPEVANVFAEFARNSVN